MSGEEEQIDERPLTSLSWDERHAFKRKHVSHTIATRLGTRPPAPATSEQLRRVLTSIADDAMALVISRDGTVYDFDVVFSEGVHIVQLIQEALTDRSVVGFDSSEALPFWQHQPISLDISHYSGSPYIDRDTVIFATDTYISMPFRSQAINRLLVDLLIAVELHAYANEMQGELAKLNAKVPRSFQRFTMRTPHPFVRVVRDSTLWFLIFGTLGWLAQDKLPDLIGSTAADSLSYILFALSFISIAALPFDLIRSHRTYHKGRKAIIDLYITMASVYRILEQQGPVSLHYLREMALDAARKGVVWPNVLFNLLDDLTSRSQSV